MARKIKTAIDIQAMLDALGTGWRVTPEFLWMSYDSFYDFLCPICKLASKHIWANILRGKLCCDDCTLTVRPNAKKRYTWKDLLVILKKYGQKIKNANNATDLPEGALIADFVPTKRSLTLICDCGREWRPTVYSFLHSVTHRCKPHRITYDIGNLINIFKKHDLTIHEDSKWQTVEELYNNTNATETVLLRCGRLAVNGNRCNNEFADRLTSLETGKRSSCGCQNGSSPAEKECLVEINNYILCKYGYCSMEYNKKGLFKESPLMELDGYIEKYKLGFEYNGFYHYGGDPTHGSRDARKRKYCKELGIRLIIIRDADFASKTKKKISAERRKACLLRVFRKIDIFLK